MVTLPPLVWTLQHKPHRLCRRDQGLALVNVLYEFHGR